MNEHRKTRRRHSAEFKSQVVEACSVPGASTAGVALAFGVNANLVRQWRKGKRPGTPH
jgi:transposase